MELPKKYADLQATLEDAEDQLQILFEALAELESADTKDERTAGKEAIEGAIQDAVSPVSTLSEMLNKLWGDM